MKAPTMQKDVYKEFHGRAYHPDVTEVYSNYTSRNGNLSNIKGNKHVAFVGLQYFIKSYLQEEWAEFFEQDKESAVKNHRRILSAMLGYPVDVKYLEDLHELGYLPLRIKALKEGTMVPYQVPCMTIVNTKPGFQWLTNMIETVLSCENWPIQTSATTAIEYFKVFKEYAIKTGLPLDNIKFQGHDFSFRGSFGKHAAAMSGFGHLASGFVGTDTITAVLFAEKYYNADVDKELVGCSVDATEHSVTCSWIMEGEIEFFKYLMTEQSPTGILSVVSDTWDFWKLVTEYLPELKDEILKRDGTIVIRPDSGDPVKILTGYNPSKGDQSVNYKTIETASKYSHFAGHDSFKWGGEYYSSKPNGDYTRLEECEVKGLIECLWDIFGGTVTDKGYKLLDDHIGAIYGDAITLERQKSILERLRIKGFASKVVLGIGSYSYQYVTRDTHGSAVKATSIVKNGERIAIYKDPKTDKKKKSAKGLLMVIKNINDELVLWDECSETSERRDSEHSLLKTVYENGELVIETNLEEIRYRINEQI